MTFCLAASVSPAQNAIQGGLCPDELLMWKLFPVCLLGAVSGFFLAVILATPNTATVSGPFVLELLPHPELYWPYPSFGALIAALAWLATLRTRKKINCEAADRGRGLERLMAVTARS
jgi:hypothetical protein